MKKDKKIKADEEMQASVASGNSILGTFEGECADSNITNLNGLDITREVWETVFASDEYKKGIELGHYIGFLGHPEDPNCMDFEHACIVMTEGHVDNAGKIQGKFNLIDTPVGRIVKTFQDAGVQFGISVRGAGDIIDNSVDPDTFVFRGFDLVAFPAYPESIPTFTEIAASSSIEDRKKYKAISAAIKKNIEGINTCEAVEILQPYFAEQSDEYQILEDRKTALTDDCCDIDPALLAEQRDAVLDLYIEELDKNKELTDQSVALVAEFSQIESSYKRKLASVERITSAQMADLDKEIDRTAKVIASSTAKVRKQSRQIRELQSKLTAAHSDNLKYKQKINANSRVLADRDRTISDLQSELNETVSKVSAANVRASNLDAEVKRLKSEIKAAESLVREYQDAYASIYANALGVNLDNVRVTASTRVDALQSLIRGSETVDMSDTYVEPTPIDVLDEDGEGLITL